MRWSIRQQVLVPIVAIQSLTIVAMTLASVALAQRRTERQTVERHNGVVEVLGRRTLPLTEGVLARMQALSGARFVAYGQERSPLAASEPGLIHAAPGLETVPKLSKSHFDSLRDSPTIQLNSEPQFAALVGANEPKSSPALLVLYPESSWRDARWESAQVPLILGAGALVLMAMATSWVALRISGRILRPEHEAASIAKGDFQELELGPHQDEVQDLSRSINLMCTQLREMKQAISQSERTHLLAQLAAGLTHQLRNALTGARMSIQLHLRRCPSAQLDPSVDVALRQLSLTEEQVRGLLTLGRSERRPHLPTDLVRVLEDVSSLLHSTCEHAKVSLVVHQQVPTAIISMDEPSLRAAVLNLALNAIEAAGPGGRVSIGLSAQGQGLMIDVSDNGPGPPLALQKTLFEPFITGKPEGVGLGLAMARNVAEAHDGSLSWTRDGARTQFRLSLPIGLAEKEAG